MKKDGVSNYLSDEETTSALKYAPLLLQIHQNNFIINDLARSAQAISSYHLLFLTTKTQRAQRNQKKSLCLCG